MPGPYEECTYQSDPHAEAKLVRCTRGAIHDVVLDLRRDSPSYLRWYAAELSADNGFCPVHPGRLCARLPDAERPERDPLPDLGRL